MVGLLVPDGLTAPIDFGGFEGTEGVGVVMDGDIGDVGGTTGVGDSGGLSVVAIGAGTVGGFTSLPLCGIGGITGGITGGTRSVGDMGLLGTGVFVSLPRLDLWGTGGLSAFCGVVNGVVDGEGAGDCDGVDNGESIEFRVSLELLMPESALFRL